MTERKIGVYVCQCGGNISDYVSVDDVVAAVQSEPDVAVARTAMFTCSDATQQEIITDIEEQNLDGIVVASCSPKLHTFTFREMCRRAGLNPYQYTQVNIREQCSWAHTDDKMGATDKATRLVRAGIARTRLAEALEPMVVETVPATVVIGGGVSGLRAALGLADIGLSVFLVEREPRLGGRLSEFERMYPYDRSGRKLVDALVERVGSHPLIKVFLESEVVGKTGSFGHYEVTIQTRGGSGRNESGSRAETSIVRAGSIVVATGFETYQVSPGEFGYGLEGVITLPDFKRLVESSEGPLRFDGRPVRSIAYIYCVGSRQDDGKDDGNRYCSRYCCTAAVHASLEAAALGPGGRNERAGTKGGSLPGGEEGCIPLRQYHLHRDIRCYGKYELLYNESREKGALYLRFPDDEPPIVEQVLAGAGAAGAAGAAEVAGPVGAPSVAGAALVDGVPSVAGAVGDPSVPGAASAGRTAAASGATAAAYRLTVTTRDVLTGREEIIIPADLVVLVTGMVPRENDELVRTLKLPVGKDGFFNEIHPKLRPVETVVDGVFICGACQGPKTSAEAVASALAAVTQSGAILKRGYAELDPLIAVIDPDKCTWCGLCLEACPYQAPTPVEREDRAVGLIERTACKGCGGCVPVCPNDAIDLRGYSDAQMRAMIDAVLKEVAACRP